MLKKLIIGCIGIFVIALVTIGAYVVSLSTPPAESSNHTSMRTYANEQYGLSFSYPDTYELTERDAQGSAERAHHTITLINHADLPLPVDGEGPPAITIDIYQNDLDHLTTSTWIRNDARSNFKLSPEGRLATTTVDGSEALSYRWSGLYEGTTVAIARTAWVYAFTVTYLQMGDPIVQDFVALRESARVR